MGYSHYQHLDVSRDGPVLTLTLNRPAALNAINDALHEEPGSIFLDEAVYGMARRLAAGPRDAIRWSKVAANIGLKQLAHSIMDTSVAYEWQTFRSPDHAEAVRAFVEKRQPRFGQETTP